MAFKTLRNWVYSAAFWRGKSYYLSIGCIVKDEDEYLEEWINYHLKIGVQHFFIYDNQSTKPVKQLMKELNLSQYVTVVPIAGEVKQLVAYTNCIKRFRIISRWIAFIDVDEFIVPKLTHGNLPALLKEYEAYGGLAINWQMFGSAGHVKRTGKPVVESFLQRAEKDFHINRHVKSIVQPVHVKSVHDPHSFIYRAPYYAVNENFNRVVDAFSDPSVDKVQINHYYCKSFDQFQDKMKRGYSDRKVERTIDRFYYHDTDTNEVEDISALEIARS
ncbi:glycosyltransferase family 92 protein [Mucilaginibacter jinjuensis]|uniref:Glycosyltransferase family 92 protein n=1 Tax=Mucilaginibacter jinjuensis TaxID=1176721 RepID=A0ABY7TBZ5_9SPHI|nr:glycosyltransferase family 92 protein [Mucilaginibacter jinjuensis]WCT12742.1 glycosyltransferase family 92 protein [Mucilaginibacter jinjuensis]